MVSQDENWAKYLSRTFSWTTPGKFFLLSVFRKNSNNSFFHNQDTVQHDIYMVVYSWPGKFLSSCFRYDSDLDRKNVHVYRYMYVIVRRIPEAEFISTILWRFLGHNLERSQTWDFCMHFLNHREGGMVFYQVLLLSPYSHFTVEIRKRLREF